MPLDSDFRDGALASELLLGRLDRAVAQFAPFLPAPLPEAVASTPAYAGGGA